MQESLFFCCRREKEENFVLIPISGAWEFMIESIILCAGLLGRLFGAGGRLSDRASLIVLFEVSCFWLAEGSFLDSIRVLRT